MKYLAEIFRRQGAELKRWSIAVIAAVAAISAHSTAGAIVYTVDRAVGDATVTGFIETDGSLGSIGSTNIVNWVLTLENDGETVELFGPLSGDNSVISAVSAFEATADTLSFAILNGVSSFQFCLELATFPNVCNLGLASWVITSNGSLFEQIRGIPGTSDQITGPIGMAGDLYQIGSAMAPPSEVPVPAAAWLFISAILGFAGVKRRGKILSS